MKISYRTILALSLILLCNNSFASIKDSVQIISVNVDIIAKDQSLALRNTKIDFKDYFITITLTNNEDSIVRFAIMKCSWGQSFTTDNNLIWVTGQDCDGNFPITIEIKPHKSIKFFANLGSRIKNSNPNNPQNFKIGFIDIPQQDLFWRHDSDIKKYKVYWSDSIELKTELNKYKIEQ